MSDPSNKVAAHRQVGVAERPVSSNSLDSNGSMNLDEYSRQLGAPEYSIDRNELEGRPQTTDTAVYDDMESHACRACVESRGDCGRRDSSWNMESGLVCTSKKRVKIKDFCSEVRASMDVEQFVHQAELVLDMKEVAIEDIVEVMLSKVVEFGINPSRLSEAKEMIFVPGSAMLMAHTVQGISWMAGQNQPICSSDLHYDQSWLCALCSLAQISQRHMVIARFKHPTKMGSNANCVRFFALILTPSKEKSTKNALETGRTFATMLMNLDFRQRLLEAKSENEFKSLMMLEAQQLSKTTKGLKNRHKYKLNADIHYSMSSLTNVDDGSDVGSLKPYKKISKLDLQKLPLDSTKVGDKYELSALASSDLNNNKSPVPSFNENTRASRLFSLIIEPSASPALGPSKLIQSDKFPSNHSHQKPDESKSNLFSFCVHLQPGKGLVSDFRRRIKHYGSDFKDAFVGPPRTIQKTIATIWFLYFGILLPTIAFSSLNSSQTHGHMGDLRKTILGQAIGGLVFALLGGQPLVIIMTTAPLCLYTKVIHQMCLDYGYSFPAMYAAVGLWNGFFLTIYSLFGFMIAFITDACKDLMKNFNKYYYISACRTPNPSNNPITPLNTSIYSRDVFNSSGVELVESVAQVCRRETSLLFIILMLGTLWLATTLYKFNKTPYLEANKREILRDYSLPTAVLVMSFLGSYVFHDIYVDTFPPLPSIQFEMAKLDLTWTGVLTSMGLGFTLSLLFFMDQNISAAMVNAPQNGLKKGCAYHFDLLVVGILNGFLTLYGLPMMHGVLPHSPLHVRSLADIEERVEDGLLREVIVNVRETRVTGIVAHLLVLCSLFLIPYPIAYIPTAVLNGLFLYMAFTSLDGLQMFERVLLLFTEQSKYPPNHYIRRCPQRKIHQFTLLQLAQLGVMCLFGFSPLNIVEMFFPVIILLMIPFRCNIIPKFINEKYLDALDGMHV